MRAERIAWLRERLKQALPGDAGHERMAARVLPMPKEIPASARPSAVLILLYPVQDELQVLLIKRTDDGHSHSGQVSFPGGRWEESDGELMITALREAEEEVGINRNAVSVIGRLSPLYIPVSNFIVHPFVAYAEAKPEYTPSVNEVARIIEISVEEMLHPERKTITEVRSPADKTFIRKVPAYQLEDGTIIWGATAMIFSELQTILEE